MFTTVFLKAPMANIQVWGVQCFLGWDAVELWGVDAARIEPLAGGVANDVWSVRVHRRLALGRLGSRSAGLS